MSVFTGTQLSFEKGMVGLLLVSRMSGASRMANIMSDIITIIVLDTFLDYCHSNMEQRSRTSKLFLSGCFVAKRKSGTTELTISWYQLSIKILSSSPTTNFRLSRSVIQGASILFILNHPKIYIWIYVRMVLQHFWNEFI